MDGSPEALLTAGLGSWGSSGLLLTLGLGIGEDEEVTITSDTIVVIARGGARAMLHATEQDDAITITASGLVISTDTTLIQLN